MLTHLSDSLSLSLSLSVLFFCFFSQVIVDVIHKTRITGEKMCGRVTIPIKELLVGVYVQKWYPVMYGKAPRSTQVGEIFLKLLLHKEGLTKEQRAATIGANLQQLKGVPKGFAENQSEGNTSSTPATVVVASNGGGGGGTTSTMNTQSQIDMEMRLQAMEKTIAQVASMMESVVERMSK